MKRNKKLKRIIMGGVGFAMAVVVFFVGSMHNMQEVTADVRVFDKITEKYPDDNTFDLNILEIVPTGTTVLNSDENGNTKETINSAAEIGYFLPFKTSQPRTPTITTHGTALATPITTINDASYGDVLYQLRTYGMIRPSGADTAGEYPIYAWYNSAGVAVFSNYENDSCTEAYSQSFVKGVYSFGTGYYNIADGYTLDENGTICKEVEVEVPAVSDNTVSGNGTVSGNEPTIEIVLEPVTDIDPSKLSLPTSTSGLEYITYVSDGTGNVNFTRSEKVTQMTEYYGYSDQVLYYMKNSNAEFYSSSYFREYVLGSKKNYADRNITYNVVQASAVTKEQVDAADLIYISGKDSAFAASDISEEVLLEIYNKEVNEHKAVMMDYACYGKNSTTNISKLAVLLWRDSQTEIRTTYTDSFQKNSNVLNSLEFLKGNALKELRASMMTGANGNFVTGNVYVYNHHLSDFDDPKSLIDAGDMFANGDFNSAYTATAMQNGFSEVLNYITATNKNSTTGSMLPSVTPAVAIQYILISDGKPLSIVKTSLNVLEIQPVTSFLFNDVRGTEEYGYLDEDGAAKTNRDNFVKSYLGNYYDDKVEYINFTSMTVDEFNGRNDDLIETYDIIYIGSEMGDLYYTDEINTRALVDGVYSTTYTQLNLPTYTDKKMYGNVYYGIGDMVYLDDTITNLYGFLDEPTYYARFQGRDITRDKLEKLKLYLDAQKLMFVEGDLVSRTAKGYSEVNPTAVASDDTRAGKNDRGRIDDSSNMYELMQYGIGCYYNYDSGKYENASTDGYYSPCYNMVSVLDVENGFVDKSTIEQYVTTEKLTLTMLKQPNEYSYSLQENSEVMDPDTVVYMEENSNGTRQLEYSFIITSDLANDSTSSTYRPYLYVDVNNDGKYSTTTENIRDMQIVIAATGAEAERDAGNNYVLYKDIEYSMTRELDESYSGYIKWKVSVQSNTYTNSHASVQGSTVIKNSGDDEVIKILQLTNNNVSNLDLQAQAADKNSLFGKYLAAVPGYRVVIKTQTVEQFEKDFLDAWRAYQASGTQGQKKSVQEYALDYFNSVELVAPATEDSGDGVVGANMLVLGFGDDFASFTSTEAIQAVQSFMENEKPVLLTHDFIMFRAPSNQVRYLRNTVGMDKYGVTQNIVESTVGNVTVAELVNFMLDSTGYKYLHSGDPDYTRSADKDEFDLIENTGKAVAYQPGSGRNTIIKYTQGLNNATLMRFRDPDVKNPVGWLNHKLADKTDWGGGGYTVDKMNDGQITSYPYALPDTFKVTTTHGQYYELDLDADDDDDGESDVVVWYTLGEADRTDFDPWSASTGGPCPADGYYIYNKGNITYTGAGHANMTTASETEAQLFINTLFAAFNATSVKPSVDFFEEAPDANDAPINSITVPYDENVTGDNAYDSSVLKDANGQFRYHFVNPNVNTAVTDLGTPMFFRLSDTNFVRGTKYMEIEYYLKAKGDAGDSYVVDNGTQNGVARTVETLEYEGATVPVVNISDLMATYHVSNKALTSKLGIADLMFMESGVVYGFYLPLSYLNDNSQVTIYIKAKTRIHTVSSQTGLESVEEVPGEGVGELTVTKADLLDLD